MKDLTKKVKEMREIKFRGESLTFDKRWVYGSLKIDGFYGYSILDNKNWVWVKVDKGTVGQSTGLKDENGKEIYEGDILRIGGIVSFGKNWAEGGNGRIGFFTDLEEFSYSMEKDEIIGNVNVYENPDILQSLKDKKSFIDVK